MGKGVLLGLLLLVMSGAYGFSSTYYHELDGIKYNNTMINEIITFEVTGSSVACLLNATGSWEPMSNVSGVYMLNVTYSTPVSGDYQVNCTSVETYPLEILPRYRINSSSVKLPMVSLETDYTIIARNYSVSRQLEPLSCSYNLSSPVGFVDNVTFSHAFGAAGSQVIPLTCGDLVGNLTFTVASYEPKLEAVSHPLSGVSSTTGFRMGVYDFLLDGVDDLVVVSNESLRVYNGADWTFFEDTTWRYSADTHLVITDMNGNGKGDILIGNDTQVDVYTMGDGWSWSRSTLFTGSNIKGFGAFELQGDFAKDLVVVNGSANQFSIQTFEGPEFIQITQTQLAVGCDKVLVFDVSRNFIEDIVCLQNTENALHFFIRDDYSLNFTYYNYTFPHAVSDFFFSDITGNGNWEVGIINGTVAPRTLTYYAINLSQNPVLSLAPFSASPQLTNHFGTLAYDSLFEQYPGLLIAHQNPSAQFPLRSIYNTLSNYSDDVSELYFGAPIVVNNEYSLIFAHYFDSVHRLQTLNNTISLYRDLDLSYTANLTTSDIHHSPNAQFSANITSDWQPAGYQLRINFTDKTWRNDIFDSRQNLRWYLNNASGSYTFNYPNRDGYTVQLRPISYAQRLAAPTTATKTDAQCTFVPGLEWVLDIDCVEFADSSLKQFALNNNSFLINDTRVQWNQVNLTTAYLQLLRTRDDIIANSWIQGYNGSGVLNITGRHTIPTKTWNTIQISDMQVLLSDTSLNATNWQFTNSTLNSSNSTLSFKNTNLPHTTLTNTTLTLNASHILSGTVINSTIHLFSGSSATITNINSTLLYYNCTTVSFADSHNTPLQRSGMYRWNGNEVGFDATHVSGCLVLQNNTDHYTYTFNFSQDWKYFPADTLFTSFEPTETILFTPTFIPYWDYATNSSHMTDFRNYSLLAHLFNLTDVKLSRPTLNATFPGPLNLTSANLSFYFDAGDDWFKATGPLGSFSFNFSGAIPTRWLLLNTSNQPQAAVLHNAGVVSGFLPAGTYRIVNNLSFSYSIPAVLADEPFTPLVSYTDYFGVIDRSSSCSWTFNGSVDVTVGFNSSVSLPQGVYNYTVACDHPDLELLNATGSLTMNPYVVSFEATRFSPFNLSFIASGFDYTTCSTCNMTLNGSFAGVFSQSASSCTVQQVLPDLVYAAQINCTDGFHIPFTLVQQDARRWFDVATLQGEMWYYATSLTIRFFKIIDNQSIMSDVLINNTGNLFNVNILQNLGLTPAGQNIFYFSGDLFNTNTTVEVIN